MRRATAAAVVLVAAALLLLPATPAYAKGARAETRRLAILIASNAGFGPQAPLRFAEEDANRLGAVLTELGGVEPGDLWLLKASGVDRVVATLAEVNGRIRAWRDRPERRAVVLLYFSGHSDGQSLELGRERLSFLVVRKLLEDTGADVRLAIIDSCRSGGLLALKGGSPGPTFEVRLSDNLASTGEAFITSSAADESALESSEIRASFFSHHLVSGLRGAADTSGDGEVTLAEAYQYAYARTLSATAGTTIGTQHPVYDYRLSGRGDLVLTRLNAPSALIETPQGFERLLLIEARTGQVLVELGSNAARRVAVPAGSYRLHGFRAGQLLRAEVTVKGGESREVTARAFVATDAVVGVRKGLAEDASDAVEMVARDGIDDQPADSFAVLLGIGVETPMGAALEVVPAVRLAVAGLGRRTPTAALNIGSAARDGLRESRFELLLGAQQRWGSSGIFFATGAELGGGVALQSITGESTHASSLVTAAATASLSITLAPRIALALVTQLPATFARRDGETTLLFRPALWLALQMQR